MSQSTLTDITKVQKHYFPDFVIISLDFLQQTFQFSYWEREHLYWCLLQTAWS